MEKKTFIKACMDFFGKQPGQSITDFGAEIKVVKDNPEDRRYFVEEFAKIGIQIVDAEKKAA